MEHKYSWGLIEPKILKLLKKDEDEASTNQFMQEAIIEAQKGMLPQKKVGVIIVKNDEIVSRSHRGKTYGEAIYHAEYASMLESIVNLNGSSMYVTLEPCSERNHGKGIQLPCCEHIIKAGIAKVYIGLPDPNPLINGGGIRRLFQAGIYVYAGNKNLESQLYSLIPNKELKVTIDKFAYTHRPTFSAEVQNSKNYV